MAENELVAHEVFIEAPPGEVFPFRVEPDKYVLWMGLSAELDARPGGVFKVDPNTIDVIHGTFIEVVPPTRLVFTWGWKQPGHPVPAGSTRVEINLPAERGGTRLSLRHHQLVEDVRERHRLGWAHYLGRLQVRLAGGDPGVDPFSHPSVRH